MKSRGADFVEALENWALRYAVQPAHFAAVRAESARQSGAGRNSLEDASLTFAGNPCTSMLQVGRREGEWERPSLWRQESRAEERQVSSGLTHGHMSEARTRVNVHRSRLWAVVPRVSSIFWVSLANRLRMRPTGVLLKKETGALKI